MKTFLVILMLAAVGVGGLYVYTRRVAVNAHPAVPAVPLNPKKQWTPEEIAKEPQSYLAWSDQQMQQQTAERERRLATLNATRQDVVNRQQALADKMQEVVNFRSRLQTAYNKAEDEDRWPVRMAGRTFERVKAQDILAQTQTWLDDRQPLADAYVSSLKKMDDSALAYQDDLRKLSDMREKLALDLERVKLNQGMAELDSLRKNETKLASMSAALSQMSEDQAPQLSSVAKTSRVDIDSLMK